jgi:hypothetical protein
MPWQELPAGAVRGCRSKDEGKSLQEVLGSALQGKYREQRQKQEAPPPTTSLHYTAMLVTRDSLNFVCGFPNVLVQQLQPIQCKPVTSKTHAPV